MDVFYAHPKVEHYFFGEYAHYITGDVESRKEAKEYLELWRKFLIRKLRTELEDYEFLEENWIDRDPAFSGPLELYSTLALKMSYKKKLPGELH